MYIRKLPDWWISLITGHYCTHERIKIAQEILFTAVYRILHILTTYHCNRADMEFSTSPSTYWPHETQGMNSRLATATRPLWEQYPQIMWSSWPTPGKYAVKMVTISFVGVVCGVKALIGHIMIHHRGVASFTFISISLLKETIMLKHFQ